VTAACAGLHYDEFHISIRKGGADVQGSGGEFIHVTMKNVVIESVSWSGADGDEALNDKVVLAYAGIMIEYLKQDMKGDLKKAGKAEWNQTTNKAKM
jgi:type VI protein secretion system component Hcp